MGVARRRRYGSPEGKLRAERARRLRDATRRVALVGQARPGRLPGGAPADKPASNPGPLRACQAARRSWTALCIMCAKLCVQQARRPDGAGCGPSRRGARQSCAPCWRRRPRRQRGCRQRCSRGASCAAWAPHRRPTLRPPLCGGASCPRCRRARARCSWPHTSGPPTSWATRRALGEPWRTLEHPGAPAPPPAAGAPGMGAPGVPRRRCSLGAAVAWAPARWQAAGLRSPCSWAALRRHQRHR